MAWEKTISRVKSAGRMLFVQDGQNTVIKYDIVEIFVFKLALLNVKKKLFNKTNFVGTNCISEKIESCESNFTDERPAKLMPIRCSTPTKHSDLDRKNKKNGPSGEVGWCGLRAVYPRIYIQLPIAMRARQKKPVISNVVFCSCCSP